VTEKTVPPRPGLLKDDTLWQTLDVAPRDREILLFCPGVKSPDGTGAHPQAVLNNKYLKGRWSEEQHHWVDVSDQMVYPSRWAEG